MMKNNLKSMVIKAISIGFVCLAAYNAVLFALCGFENHGGAFWSSYTFMMLGFVSLTISALLLKFRQYQPKDWLLGYPIFKHCTIYIALELAVSILFVALDYKQCPWAIAFAVQLILFSVHLVFVISCFLAKEKIEEVTTKVKESTSFFKFLKIDAETVAENSSDENVKAAFLKLADEIHYSDYVSNPALENLEKQISDLINESNVCVSVNDNETALKNCKKAMILLSERNKKCQALK